MPFMLVHRGLANVCLIFSLLIGLYGVWRAWRHGNVGRRLWGMLVTTQMLYLAQDIVGVIMLSFQGLNPARGWIHFLYGGIILITLPTAYVLTRGRDGHRETTLYTVLGFFLAGVVYRAMSTG